jgi:hypothetical protein
MFGFKLLCMHDDASGGIMQYDRADVGTGENASASIKVGCPATQESEPPTRRLLVLMSLTQWLPPEQIEVSLPARLDANWLSCEARERVGCVGTVPTVHVWSIKPRLRAQSIAWFRALSSTETRND